MRFVLIFDTMRGFTLPARHLSHSGTRLTSWPLLAVQPDHLIRTTDVDHVRTVQAILQQVYDQDDIYFSEYSGLYCKGCEPIYTEHYGV